VSTPTRPRRLVLTLSGRRLPRSLNALLRTLGDGGVPELHAMFIEDSDLLKAVSLPFVFEFCVATSARRPVDRARIEAQLRSEAAAAERDLAELARTSGLRWHFEIVRERSRAVVTRALAVTDAVVVTPRGETAGADAGQTIVCIAEDNEAGARARTVARALATAEHLPLEDYHLATTTPGPDAAATSTDAHHVTSTSAPHTDATARALTTAALPSLLRHPGHRLVVINGSLIETLDASIHDLAEISTAPLVIVR